MGNGTINWLVKPYVGLTIFIRWQKGHFSVESPFIPAFKNFVPSLLFIPHTF